MNQIKILSLSVSLLLLSACTEAGETTKVSAATGGVIGAGLGAIVGSQSGNAGQGLVLGALVGAGTGGYVGNSIEAQEKAIKTQDAAIEKQQALIREQATQIEQLRNRGNDAVPSHVSSSARTAELIAQLPIGAPASPREAPRQVAPMAKSVTSERPIARIPSAPPAPVVSSARAERSGSGLVERDLNAATTAPKAVIAPIEKAVEPEAARGNYAWKQPEAIKPVPEIKMEPSALNAAPISELSAECKKAHAEAAAAQDASDNADQLFHYRRALRMCPNDAELHTRLGKVYLKLDRKSDAEFEFREALNIDPRFEAAKSGLSGVTGAK